MKFIVLGKYTKQGTDGWLDNPDEDRHAMQRLQKIEKPMISSTRGNMMVATAETV